MIENRFFIEIRSGYIIFSFDFIQIILRHFRIFMKNGYQIIIMNQFNFVSSFDS